MDKLLQRLYRRNLHTVKLGLDEMRALLAGLDNPQDAFLSIHVAGTNGKGSVCALLASVLQAAGFRTGLYTSPHLVRFNERVRINGEPLSDADLARGLKVVEKAAARLPEQGLRDVTFFEFTTALAFAAFREQKVQVVVVETGMGGRLDATNVVTPVVSVITPIGLDHMAYLGSTVEVIAGEKAGIIKSGRPVVMAAMDPKATLVLRRVARERGAPVIPAAESVQVRRSRQTLAGQRVVVETEDEAIGPVALPLLGSHQLANVATAVTALVAFREACHLPLAGEAIAKGLASVHWPARLQILEQDPPVILDGAHNPPAARILAESWHELFPRQPIGLVAGFLSDKDVAGCLREWTGSVKRVWLVRLSGERAMPMADMVVAARGVHLDALPMPDLASALADAKSWAAEQRGVVAIAGSLHLAGEVLKHYRLEA